MHIYKRWLRGNRDSLAAGNRAVFEPRIAIDGAIFIQPVSKSRPLWPRTLENTGCDLLFWNARRARVNTWACHGPADGVTIRDSIRRAEERR